MKSINILGTEIKEWDEVIITGIVNSESTKPLVENLEGTVGTVSLDDNFIKVWPKADLYDGKLWFKVSDISAIRLI